MISSSWGFFFEGLRTPLLRPLKGPVFVDLVLRESGMRLRGGGGGGLFPEHQQQWFLAVGQAVVGQVQAVTKRLEGSQGQLKAGGTELTGIPLPLRRVPGEGAVGMRRVGEDKVRW